MDKEKSNNTEQDGSNSGWEELQDGPEKPKEDGQEAVITSRDVEYFKNNPKELSGLVSDLVRMRGGKEAIKKGATWSKEERAFVGEDGLPRDWSHLTGYLKRNPDAIGGVLEEYNTLRQAEEESVKHKEHLRELMHKYPRLPGEKTWEWKARIDAEEAKSEELSNAEESNKGNNEVPAVVDDVLETPDADIFSDDEDEDAGDPAVEESVSEDLFAEAAAVEYAEDEEDFGAGPTLGGIDGEKIVSIDDLRKQQSAEELSGTFEEQMNSLNHRIDDVRTMQEQSAVWEKMKVVFESCSPNTQAELRYLRAQEGLAIQRKLLEDKKAKLSSLPIITLPWSKAHEQKRILKYTIESSAKSLKYLEEEVLKLEATKPKSLTDEERARVDAFRAIDARMLRLNSDLHTRQLGKEIGMRKTWIQQQQDFLKNGNKDMADAPPDKMRRMAIAKWQDEIIDLQAEIDSYKAEHPDFEMDPSAEKADEATDEELDVAA